MFSSLVRPMANNIARNSVRGLRSTTKRLSDAEHAEHVKTMLFWRKISLGALPVLALLGAFNVYLHFSHEHHHEETPAYPYLKIRKKKFPWECSDCDLFDRECHRKCKEEMKASS